jgi:hypothetical protein
MNGPRKKRRQPKLQWLQDPSEINVEFEKYEIAAQTRQTTRKEKNQARTHENGN